MKQQNHGDQAARLPEDVLADVLRRLAAPRWFAVSRCVCKAWRAIIDARSLLRTDLPFSGIFIYFDVLPFPEFFSRPSSTGTPAISGKLDFLPPPCFPSDGIDRRDWNWDDNCVIRDHCNGLLLFDKYVVNPATRRWDPLPPPPPNLAKGVVSFFNGFLVFDPTVSPNYQVFMIPHLYPAYGRDRDDVDPLEDASEWPPSPCILHVFSSRSGRWEERSFVAEGNAAGTVAKTQWSCRGLLSVYWRGSLYVFCQTGFVMRISLSEDKYRVIKLPMGTGRNAYLGRSEKGVYLASFIRSGFQVWILNESCGQVEWMLKRKYDLEPVRKFDHQVHGPWTLEDINYDFYRSCLPEINKKAIVQEKFEWNSENDDFCENEDVVEACHNEDVDIDMLGFHPYKEILFLSRSESFRLNATALAYHLNSLKVEGLGSIYPTVYDHFDSGLANEVRDMESFPYTPCSWIEEFPRNS